MTRRVMVTGMGDVTAFGEDWQAVPTRLLAYENAVRKMPEWQVYDGLHTLLEVSIDDSTLPEYCTRKRICAMGRVSLMSTRATKLASKQAGLTGDWVLTNDETGVAYGSSTGSAGPVNEFATMLTEKHTNNITGTIYVQVIPHTAAVNTGLLFGLYERVIPIFSACTSGSQAIGYTWEAIRHGCQTVMVAGGTEEPCPPEAVVFDTLLATSQCNDESKTTPSPFDEKRDSLIVGEGADTLVLEELGYAKAHGATIYGEIVNFVVNCDAAYIIQLQRETMQICMEKSLNMAGTNARDIGYISVHGIAIDRGDVTGSQATSAIYGNNVPLSLLKSYSGCTFGTCGAPEAWTSLQMMREGWFALTSNLSQPDINYGTLDYIMDEARKIDRELLRSNNSALGGINTSITIKRWP